ncbi:unnamed protein product [Dibothriocephalus latus]|uniref:Uncharacterized protein n=1 Tax=Dibothriocephalus latus TaxID=60516 RepID=A0A3P7LSR8_DIBLA|nr:unnamed protein product [Dibothriocephalus latus]
MLFAAVSTATMWAGRQVAGRIAYLGCGWKGAVCVFTNPEETTRDSLFAPSHNLPQLQPLQENSNFSVVCDAVDAVDAVTVQTAICLRHQIFVIPTADRKTGGHMIRNVITAAINIIIVIIARSHPAMSLPSPAACTLNQKPSIW